MKKIALALCATLALSVSAYAAPIDLTNGNLPVDVSSDKMEYNSDKDTVVFSGKVEAVRGEFTMWSDFLTLFMKSGGNAQKQANSGASPVMKQSSLDRIVAERNVRFKNGDQNGSAGKATFYSEKNLLVLEGNPVLNDGKNSIRGNVIRYYINESRSVVEGSTKQRVHAVFSGNK